MTFLRHLELDNPTHCPKLNDALAELREVTRRNWQLIETEVEWPIWSLKKLYHYKLFIEMPDASALPFKTIRSDSTAEVMLAYVNGYLDAVKGL